MWVSCHTRPDRLSLSSTWAVDLDLQVCYHHLSAHVAKELGAIGVECPGDIEYHTDNILVWCARCFLCRLKDDNFEPGDLYVNFIENNYGADFVHAHWISDLYWAVHTCIHEALPGYSQRHVYEGRLAVNINQVNMVAFHKLRVVADALTIQRLQCLVVQ